MALYNLGCKVNSYEIEVMRQSFQEKGYKIVPFDEIADIYIINTCTVTNIADRKSRQMLHRAKQQNPGAVVVAVGCYVQTGQREVEEDGSVDLAVGNKHKKDIVDIVEKHLEERRKKGPAALGRKTLPDTLISGGGKFSGGASASGKEKFSGGAGASGGSEDDFRAGREGSEGAAVVSGGSGGGCRADEYEETQLRRTGEHTRAYIKIQDGCNQFCSYCVIPYARGRIRSRRAEDVLREIRGMAEAGYREAVLTGIHISSYGMDFPEDTSDVHTSGRKGTPLMDLIERIHEIRGLERIRLGSLEPRLISPEMAARLAGLPKICPHFHLSLQSGCDATLKRMNRHYTTGEYYKSVENLRKFFDAPAITTDVIVGFPQETEEEFEQTKEFLEKIRFYEMHIFKYSKRSGTAAASMPGQVPEQIKALRSSELFALEKQQSMEFRRRYIGREAEVLLEEVREIEGRVFCIGHTKDYVKVALETDSVPGQEKAAPNMLVKVPVSGFLTEEILV